MTRQAKLEAVVKILREREAENPLFVANAILGWFENADPRTAALCRIANALESPALAAICSAADSLKRIADALEWQFGRKPAQPPCPIVPASEKLPDYDPTESIERISREMKTARARQECGHVEEKPKP
jgi:hypothetical protein